MIAQQIAVSSLALLLAGCSCKGPTEMVEDGTVQEITLYGAHSYEDCGAKRGCRREYVPDTWFLNFRADVGHNDTLKIKHPPWDWQLQGKRIRVKWAANCSMGSQTWYWTGFDPIEPPKT